MHQTEGNSIPDRRTMDAEFRASVATSFATGSERMRRIEHSLDVNTETLRATAAATAENSADIKAVLAKNDEMYELFSAMKGGFKVLEWLGRLAKWVAGLVAAGGVLAKLFGWRWPFQ